MAMTSEEMAESIRDAEKTLRRADSEAQRMASLCVGRLRHVGKWTLQRLKRELSQFNAHTGEWKS